MSDLIVKVTTVEEVLPHPNADRLSIIRVFGWYVVTQKDSYKVGDKLIYIPVDSVLDAKFIAHFFGPVETRKIKPDSETEHRVKSIKIRQSLSQGIVQGLNEEIFALYPALAKAKVGDDVAHILNITKYEPPAAAVPRNMQGKQAAKRHPDFKEYTDIQNIKWYQNVFDDTVQVYGRSCTEPRQDTRNWLPMCLP